MNEATKKSLCRRAFVIGGRESLNHYTIFSELAGEAREKLLATTHDTQIDRAAGCVTGMAVGDAVGAPLEFLPAVDRPSRSKFDFKAMKYDNENNTFRLKRGQWTDDAAMGLCMADSLLVKEKFDGSDMRARFWSWWFQGYNNAFRLDAEREQSCGLGGNISQSLFSLQAGEAPTPFYEAKTQDSGNGSLMRLAPVPVFYHTDIAAAREHSALSSYTTHPGPIAAEACKLLAHIIVRAIHRGTENSHQSDGGEEGLDVTSLSIQEMRKKIQASGLSHADCLEKSDLRERCNKAIARDAGRPAIQTFLLAATQEYLEECLAPRGDEAGTVEIRRLIQSREAADSLERCWNWKNTHLDIEGTLRRRGSTYNGYPVSAGYFGAYSVDGLAVALHSVFHSSSFEDTIERCVNHLGDADSTGSIAGQIAGAFYGFSAIPEPFKAQLGQWDQGEVTLRGVLLGLDGAARDGDRDPPGAGANENQDGSSGVV